MFKRLLIVLVLINSISCSKAEESSPKPIPPKTEAKAPSPDLVLDKTSAPQGEFFQAIVKDSKHKPRIWFNSGEFTMYEIQDPNEWQQADKNKEPDKKVYRALIPVENLTKPGSYSILAREGEWQEKIPVTITDNNKPVSKITLSKDKSGLSASSKEINIVGSSLGTRTNKKLWQSKFIYPSTAPKSSPFGVKRSYNGGPVTSYHKGLDFAADMGAPVYAPADGKVIAVGKESEGFVVHGNCIIIDHGHAVTSIYLHLSKTEVKKDDFVYKGQKIGEVGHTGISTGPHLHWGVYLYGVSTEPELFVQKNIH